MPKLHVYTPVWGTKHLNLLDQALGRSFRFPLNARALENCIWTLQTDADSELLKEIAKRAIPTAEVRIIINPRLREQNAPIGAMKIQGLLRVIKQCLDERSPMLMATPDFIYGNGTIPTLLAASGVTRLEVGQNTNQVVQALLNGPNQGLCVSVAHLRALPTLLTALDEARLDEPSNAALIGAGLAFAHCSWKLCELGLNPHGIFHSGISWRRLTPAHIPDQERSQLLLVTHQMPSPFLVNFLPSDLDFFATWKGITPPAFGEWDHNWPTELLKQGRLRYIGASDAACMVEITDSDKNLPPVLPTVPGRANDEFFLINYHNSIQKQFMCVFRYI